MVINVSGMDQNRHDIKAQWSLLSLHDNGPFVPILATSAVIEKLKTGKVASGAAIADTVLSLNEIEMEMKFHEISTQVDIE